jgi:hypothetical protein
VKRWRRRLEHLEALTHATEPLRQNGLTLHVSGCTLTRDEAQALAQEQERHLRLGPESLTDIAVCVVEVVEESSAAP